MIADAHSHPIKEIFELLGSDPEIGLNEDMASERLKSEGENILTRKKPKSVWKILSDQFLSPIIYILFAAMVLAFVFN